MHSLFQKRDPWGQGWSLWILAGLAFLAPLMLWALRGLRLDNDMQTWLPAGDREAQAFQWFRQHFPDEQRVIVTWEGSTLKDPRIHRFAELLRGEPGADGIRRGGSPYVAAVYTPHDTIARMVRYEVDAQEALRRLEGVLIGQGWMKVRLTEAGRADPERSIREVVAHIESRLGITLTVHDKVTDWIDAAYLAELDAQADSTAPSAAESAAPMIPEHDYQWSWEGMQARSRLAEEIERLALAYRGFATSEAPSGRPLIEKCFFAVGTPIAVAVTLSEAGGAEPELAVAAIRQAAVAAGVPEPLLHLGGRAVTTAALNTAVKEALWNPAARPTQLHKRSIILLSGVVGLILAFVFLRSLRLGILVVGASWYATGLALSLIPLTGGTMNMVLVVMPTLLMVLSLSSAIHVANYWRHAAFETPATAVSRALALARQPCVMAALTTAIGLASLAFSSLAPVRDFGLYSAAGCLVMLGVVLLGLPALLQVWPGRRPSLQDVDGLGWKQFGLLLYRRWKLVSGTCLVLSLAAAWGLRWFQTETKVVRYFPPTSRLVQDYLFLERNLAGITPVDIVIRFDKGMQERSKFLERLEIVREAAAQVRQHPEITGAVCLADFQPVYERPEPNAKRAEMVKYLRKSQGVEKALKGEMAGESAAFFTVAAGPAEPLSPGDAPLHEPGDELWRISAQASVMSDANYVTLTRELNARVQGVTRYYPGASHVVTGAVPLFLRTQEAVLESLIVSFGLAFGVISVVMMWLLRDVLAGLLSMLPNLLPVGFVFGLLAWNGQRIDIGTMITASVALGIAVDGTLHLLTWFRDGLRRGQSRFRATVEALAHCAPAMWQTSAAVGIGLLMLSPAELQLISRFGWLMAALMAAALVADLVLLPALLAGWLGALLERRLARRPAARPAEEPAPLLRAPHIPLGRLRESVRNVG